MILTVNGKKIGIVTSGTVSPVLEKPIALGYVETGLFCGRFTD